MNKLFIVLTLCFVSTVVVGKEFYHIDLDQAGWTGRFETTELTKAEWTTTKVETVIINGKKVDIKKKVKVDTPDRIKHYQDKQETKKDYVKINPKQNTDTKKSTVIDYIGRQLK